MLFFAPSIPTLIWRSEQGSDPAFMKVSPIVQWKNKLNNPIRMDGGPINNVSAATTEERTSQAGTDEVEKEEQPSTE